MRTTTLISFALLAASSALAATTCGNAPSSNSFASSSCTQYRTCDTTFCRCVNATASTTSYANASVCMSAAGTTTSCATIQTCLTAYTECVLAIESLRSSTEAACNITANQLHVDILYAAAWSYTASPLQASCRHRVCSIMNSSAATCSFGVNDSNVCRATATLPPVPSTTASPRYLLKGTLRLSGSQWQTLLANAARRLALESAVRGDMATLLRIAVEYIQLLNMSIGSLIVDFAVTDNVNATFGQLQTALMSGANNTNWLTSVKSVYALVSNETIQVLNLAVVESNGTTAAPGTPTPTLPGGISSPSAAPAVEILILAFVTVLTVLWAL